MAHDHGGWKKFGLRGLPVFSGRTRVELPEPFAALVEQRRAGMTAPFVGVTTDEVLGRGLRTLEELTSERRELALGILRARLSARGYEYARAVMHFNGFVADLLDHEQFGEWLYFLWIFGTPGTDEPWGWQIDGHHLCISTVVFDGRIATTPTFLGSEPRSAGDLSIFDPEEESGLTLIGALDDSQRARAIIHPSIRPADLPDLQDSFVGRQVGGIGRDNAVVPYQGVPATEMGDTQRGLLLEIAADYAGWIAGGTPRCGWTRCGRTSTRRCSPGTAATATRTPSTTGRTARWC
jgi:hypothetical protein